MAETDRSRGRLALSRYHVASPRFVDERDGAARRVVFAARSGELRVIGEVAWAALRDGRFGELDDDGIVDLTAIELLVAAEEDELATLLRRNEEAIADQRGLSLVVCPTAACQLGCAYCGQEHTRRWLSEHHQKGFLCQVERKLRRGRFDAVEICWFGAEPLMGMDVIRALTPRVRALAQAHGCRYTSRIITNGLALTARRATELVREHDIVGIDVTLDGDRDAHDARRHTKTGRHTFDRIFANLVALARRDDLDVEITLRSNVDATNCESVSPLIERLAAAGVQRRIGYYVAPIHAWGNEADSASLAPELFAARETGWLAEMLQRGFPVGLIPGQKRIVCMAVQREAVVVDASGTLYNCTEAPYVPAYNAGEFQIGHVAGEEYSEQRLPLAGFNERVARRELPCANCRMLPVCGGACPKAWLEDARPCPSALYNMPQRLLLAYAASVTEGAVMREAAARL